MTAKFRVIQGDCRDHLGELPNTRVAIIADPPYGIRFIPNNRHRVTQKRDTFGPIHGDDKPFDPSHLMRFENVALFGANYYADKLPARGGWLVWDKKNGTTPDDSSDCELIWTNRDQAIRMFRYLWRGIVKQNQTREDENGFRLHPNQKPVDVYKWIIAQLKLPPDTLIVDPYMGSGPCGVAAGEMGYDFLGIEINAEYFLTAERRIFKAFSKPPLFIT